MAESAHGHRFQGQLEHARQLMESGHAQGGNESVEFTDMVGLLRPKAWQERLGADACGARAQLALAEKSWEDAETAAAQMITAIEGMLFKAAAV